MKKKRWGVPVPKPGRLEARYGRDESYNNPSIVYVHGGGGSHKADARILCNALEEVPVHGGKTLCKELEARGYDLTTLRFSIDLKPAE